MATCKHILKAHQRFDPFRMCLQVAMALKMSLTSAFVALLASGTGAGALQTCAKYMLTLVHMAQLNTFHTIPSQHPM